jgi:hypothetical protein
VDIDSRGIPSVEALLFSKYLMYRTVYWHHSVRSATAMIKKALIWGLETGRLRGEELYHLDDSALFALMEGRPGGLFSLAARVREGAMYDLAAEFPFDSRCHRPLLAIMDRSRREAVLAAELSARAGLEISGDEVLIDVPEPFSLETGLYIRNEGRDFSRGSAAFSPETVQSFVRSLYVVRIFIHPRHEEGLRACRDLDGALYLGEKWLED